MTALLANRLHGLGLSRIGILIWPVLKPYNNIANTLKLHTSTSHNTLTTCKTDEYPVMN